VFLSQLLGSSFTQTPKILVAACLSTYAPSMVKRVATLSFILLCVFGLSKVQFCEVLFSPQSHTILKILGFGGGGRQEALI
jgi:cyanate permease